MRRRRNSLQRYLGDGETPILVTRQHPFALIGSAARTLGLLVPLALAAWGIAGVELLQGPIADWLVRIELLGMFGLVCVLAWGVLRWEFERVMITEEKVIHIEGVLQRRIASTPLAKVSEFTVRQPLLGRVFDFGSLVVDVPGGRDQALHGLAYIPDPAGMYRLVSDLARRGRLQEGGARVTAPSAEDLARLDLAQPIEHTQPIAPVRPDPWAPTLEGDEADHTIAIPRIPPVE